MDELKIQRANDSPLESSSESRRIEGYALKFDQPSHIMYDHTRAANYTEVITRNSVTQEILDKSDVICRLDHNPDKMLARSKFGKGTLTLTVDEIGVKYSFEAPNTAAGDEALELIRRGDISGSSFFANVKRQDLAWTKTNGELTCRIMRFGQFFDVSPVQSPAYECTEAVVRSMATEAQEGKPEPQGYRYPENRKNIFNNY